MSTVNARGPVNGNATATFRTRREAYDFEIDVNSHCRFVFAQRSGNDVRLILSSDPQDPVADDEEIVFGRLTIWGVDALTLSVQATDLWWRSDHGGNAELTTTSEHYPMLVTFSNCRSSVGYHFNTAGPGPTSGRFEPVAHFALRQFDSRGASYVANSGWLMPPGV